MPLVTDNESRAHPQKCLIPGAILTTLFSGRLSERHEEVIHTSLEEMSPFIEKHRIDTRGNKFRYWLCMALGHPNAGDEELIRIADELDLSINQLLNGAALTARIDLFEKLLDGMPSDLLQEIIKADDYSVFRYTAMSGNLPMLEHLLLLAPDEQSMMIAARDYDAFRVAVLAGHLPMVERLLELASAKRLAMIKADNYAALISAVQGSHLHIMMMLLEFDPAETQAMIKAHAYGAFRMAAKEGNLLILDQLISLVSLQTLYKMVQVFNYTPIRLAALGGHLAVVERLLDVCPDEKNNIIYTSFLASAEGSHLMLLVRLRALLSPAEFLTMIKADDYALFHSAVMHGHAAVVNYLLCISEVMDYAGLHDEQYASVTYPFIMEKVALLRGRHDEVVDIEEVAFCLYFLRSLICWNDPECTDDISFLLEIPAVRSLAHLQIWDGGVNELFRAALRNGNQAAAEILLAIPAVKDSAADDDYYRDEVPSDIDLHALLGDAEPLDATVPLIKPLARRFSFFQLKTERETEMPVAIPLLIYG